MIWSWETSAPIMHKPISKSKSYVCVCVSYWFCFPGEPWQYIAFRWLPEGELENDGK